jgi:nitrite reductase/ring-hydroxylating ferredoxin subunit
VDNRYPFPIPFGWYCIGYPEDFPAGTAKALYYFGRHLVAWRDADEALHLHDAFCPHLGAHLGHGGTVQGCELVCPFHGWHYDTTGTNTHIPYSDRTNRRARLHTYPVLERNGLSLAWYHPDNTEPLWDIPQVTPDPAVADGKTAWSDVIRHEYMVDASVQELSENAVDAPHFRILHNTSTVPVIESFTTGFPEAVLLSAHEFPTPVGAATGRIDNQFWGPGVSLVSVTGIVDTLNYACNTPIEADRCHVRFNLWFDTGGDKRAARGIGRIFMAEVDQQFRQDMPIWEHKAHLVRPALVDNDGPIMKFRSWMAQFYAESSMPQDDRLVCPPPYWPDRVDDAPSKTTVAVRYARVSARSDAIRGAG